MTLNNTAIRGYVSSTAIGTFTEYDMISATGAVAWEAAKTWKVGEYVTDEGQIFLCKAEVTSATHPKADAAHWNKFQLSNICIGPENNLWFSIEGGANKVGVFNVNTHAITLYAVGSENNNFGGILYDPVSGFIFLSNFTAEKIHKIKPSNGETVESFAVTGAGPGGLCIGADGNLWFMAQSKTTEGIEGSIGRISTTGTGLTYFKIGTTKGTPHGVNLGFDGQVWFCEFGEEVCKISKINTSGVVTQIAPTKAKAQPYWVNRGPDGNMWFTCTNLTNGNQIGRVNSAAGTVQEFTITSAEAQAGGIWAGPDGNMWFVEKKTNKIGRCTPQGVITEYTIPTASSNPDKIVMAPSGILYFTEHDTAKIGVIQP